MNDFHEMLAETLAHKCAEDLEYLKKLEAFAPKFAIEEDALAYASRIATLKPGDRVRLPTKNADGLHDGVYVGNGTGCRELVFLVYDVEDRHLALQTVSWGLIVLPD